MKMIFVGNLPPDATEQEITQNLFSTHGRVRSLRLVRDVFSGNLSWFRVCGNGRA
jgi:RNA recognition motif-containing protein